MSTEDGGSAFPRHDHRGMTLRDWFAGKFVAASVANPTYDSSDYEWAARFGYELADAMLIERAKEKP